MAQFCLGFSEVGARAARLGTGGIAPRPNAVALPPVSRSWRHAG